MAIAISDVGTILHAKIGEETAFSEFLRIIAAPATGAAPESLDSTELASPKTQSIKGRETTPDMEFDYNYTEDNFATAKTAVTGEVEEFLLIYGDGSGALIKGQASTWTDAVGRNSVVVGKFFINAESVENKTAVEVTDLLPD